jgi:hypothetical protein
MSENGKDQDNKVVPFNRASKTEGPTSEREAELIHYVFKFSLEDAALQYKIAQENGASPDEIQTTIKIMAGIIGGVPNEGAQKMLINDLKEAFPGDDLLLPQIAKAEDDIRNGLTEYVPPIP